MGTKAALYSAAIGLVGVGLGMFVVNLYGTGQDVFRTAGSNEPETAIPLGRFTPNDHIYFLVLGTILSVICLAVIWLGKNMFKKARKIEPVALLRNSSAIPLPEADTLVRASQNP
jgi:Na+/H+-dicarboxylate symporter